MKEVKAGVDTYIAINKILTSAEEFAKEGNEYRAMVFANSIREHVEKNSNRFPKSYLDKLCARIEKIEFETKKIKE